MSQTQSNQGRNLTPPVHQDMARSFPALFQRQKLLGKRRFHCVSNAAKAAKVPKCFRCNCYLLHKNTETTPHPSKELEHILAGLGKRNLIISEDMDHAQLSTQLSEAYPKMKILTGGWLLKKHQEGKAEGVLLFYHQIPRATQEPKLRQPQELVKQPST